MAITDEIRKAFDDCTVMAGVENDFECVYVTKAAALLYLNEIDAAFRELLEENERFIIKLNAEHIACQNVELDNAKLRELLQRTWDAFHDATAREFVTVKNELRELGVEVDG